MKVGWRMSYYCGRMEPETAGGRRVGARVGAGAIDAGMDGGGGGGERTTAGGAGAGGKSNVDSGSSTTTIAVNPDAEEEEADTPGAGPLPPAVEERFRSTTRDAAD